MKFIPFQGVTPLLHLAADRYWLKHLTEKPISAADLPDLWLVHVEQHRQLLTA
jgi:hypothetical protein